MSYWKLIIFSVMIMILVTYLCGESDSVKEINKRNVVHVIKNVL